MSNKRIIIVGKGGSGKDFLAKKFVEKGFVKNISYTTRPKRENEIDAVDYFFEKIEIINKLKDSYGNKSNQYFQEHDEFNGWFYGTSIKQWNKADIFIKTPRGIEKISPEDRKNCFIIYLDISQHHRQERLLKRSDVDSVVRRLEADEEDFKNFTDYDIRITNPDF